MTGSTRDETTGSNAGPGERAVPKGVDSAREGRLGGLWIAMAVVALIWGTFWYVIVKLSVFEGQTQEFFAARGQFGDMFGAVNALFSALAFSALFFATWLQKRELYYQRLQLEGQRSELQQTREVFEKQTFENTFFHLLTLHHEIVNATSATTMNAVGLPKELKGREAFEYFFDRLRTIFKHNTKDRAFPADAEVAFDILHSWHAATLGHYFRNLYHVVKFVHKGSMPNKQFYVDLLRAQLSTNEQLLLFYNCTVGRGRPKFLPKALHYGLFDEMPEEQLLAKAHVKLAETEPTGAVYDSSDPVLMGGF